MKLTIEKPVTIITPTIGYPELKCCTNSVKNQTYRNLKHLLVVDGPEKLQAVDKYIPDGLGNFQLGLTPENTGANGFYGHRIYAAYPHLINSDYIAFLDEDNFLQPDHIELLVQTLEREDLDFVYSLRNIYSKEGRFLCEDNCESLGKWPIFFDDGSYLIDTSSFLFRKDFLTEVCHFWNHGWGGDRRFLNLVKKNLPAVKYNTSGKHTLNYRLDGNPNSVKADFFIKGNKTQEQRYKGRFPWIKKQN